MPKTHIDLSYNVFSTLYLWAHHCQIAHPIFWFLKKQQPVSVKCIKEAKKNDCPQTKETYSDSSKGQGSKNYSKRVKREVKKTLQEPEPITWNFQKFVIDKGGKVVMNYHT